MTRWLCGRWFAALLAVGFGAAGCGRSGQEPDREAPSSFDGAGDRAIDPLPLSVEFDRGHAALGELLFDEPLMSGDGKVTCSSCHRHDHALADPRPHSQVDGRPETSVNTPTLYNVRFLYKLRWDGKFDELGAQLDALMKNPTLMGSTWEAAAQRLARKPSYLERFARAFPDGLTGANLRSAMTEYEHSLLTPNAPFDRYLRGDEQAISAQAKLGYKLFKSYGCASCHQGRAVGGNLFQRFGAVRDYLSNRPQLSEADFGRYNVTHREADRFVFRVPSLRNVALTAPYFHDGSAPTLGIAVTIMAAYQLGRELDAGDRDAIVAFLNSLTGEHRGKAP